jgi:hypothetical protein
MSWVGVGVAAATTIAKTTGDAAKERSSKQLAAKTQEFSPWTKLQAQPVQYANPAGSLASGAATAFGVHQGLSAMNGAAPAAAGADAAATPGASFAAQQNASLGNPQFGIGVPGQTQNPWAGALLQDPYNPQYQYGANTTVGS